MCVLDVPLITIGITYYRASDTIEKAVSSALAQTWKNIEIIIVDDCSNDGQEAILKAFQDNHPEITVIHHRFNTGWLHRGTKLLIMPKENFWLF